jgi:hypothetical protein
MNVRGLPTASAHVSCQRVAIVTHQFDRPFDAVERGWLLSDVPALSSAGASSFIGAFGSLANSGDAAESELSQTQGSKLLSAARGNVPLSSQEMRGILRVINWIIT